MAVEIDHILTFIKVVEQGSFTAAADALRVSKSVVSKHVTSLEEALGCQLLKRTTRKLIVTDVGHAYYSQVKSIPDQIQSAQLSLQTYADEPKGVLKVIAPANFAASLKTNIIPDYLLAHTNITLNMNFVRPAEDYINDDFDIIILWKLNNTNFPDYNLVPTKLFSMPVGLYVSPQYLEQQEVLPSSAKDLVNYNCISSIGRKWPFREEDGSLYYVYTSGNLETSHDEVIREATVRGVGIAYAYPFLFAEDLQAGRVVPLLPSHTQLMLEVYAFYHPTPYLPVKIRNFVDTMKHFYRGIQEEINKRGQC